MNSLTTKFGLGEQVWKINRSTEMIGLPCRICRGRGWLDAQGARGARRSVKCPDCGMDATVLLGSWPQWRVETTPLVIGMVQVKIFDRSGVDNGKREDNMNPARVARLHEADEESYMCWSTGVGSGTLHYVEDLFAVRSDAEAEAQLRTERARRGENPGGRESQNRPWWPNVEQVRVAQGFLDHRDVYEHDAGHIALAQQIVEVAAVRDPSDSSRAAA